MKFLVFLGVMVIAVLVALMFLTADVQPYGGPEITSGGGSGTWPCDIFEDPGCAPTSTPDMCTTCAIWPNLDICITCCKVNPNYQFCRNTLPMSEEQQFRRAINE